MKDIFQNIRAVGFDLDGTLYSINSQIDEEIANLFAEKVLLKHPELGSLEEAKIFGEKKYKEIESRAKTLEVIGYEKGGEMMEEILCQVDGSKFLSRDEKLIELLKEIRKAKEYIYLITTAPSHEGRRKLEKLGVEENVFDIIVYGDHEVIVGKPKDESAFRYVVEKSGIPAENHVYIGDREKADILPPKSIGMKTIAVGKEILSADESVPFVYDIESLII